MCNMEETEIASLGIDFSRIVNLSDTRFSSYGSMAQIAEGDIIPDGELTFINKQGQIESVSIYSLITNKKVIFLGVIGAFITKCSLDFAYPMVKKADKFKSCGVDKIFCISVNDPFVMMGWELASNNQNQHMKFLADSTGTYVRSLGLLNLNPSPWGCGIRSRRFLLVVEDRMVKIARSEIANIPKVLTDTSVAYRSMSPIAVGDIIPDGQVHFLDEEDRYQLRTTSIYSIATGKKIMLFGVPGAFETTFSTKYVHAIIEKADILRWKGIQGIYCISVNDPDVMKGWELRDFKNNGHIKFLADTTAAYVKSLGVDVDLSSMKLGIRSMRFCLVVNDLKVTVASFSKDFSTDIFEYI